MILADEAILAEDYGAVDILHRDGQKKRIAECVEPLASGRRPINVFLYGPPGTGKTLMTKHVLDELKKESSVRCVYVNCWGRPTMYAILYEVLIGLGVFVSPHEPLSELINKFSSASKGKALIALDEVDQMENDKVLYNLSRNSVGLICVSNNKYALATIDDRIKSSLAFEPVEFQPYTVDEIADILWQRAKYALVPNAIKREDVLLAARFANGDARVGIGIIRNAALLAERGDARRVDYTHVKKAFEAARFLKRNRLESNLSEDETNVLEVVRSGVSGPGEIYARYSKVSKKPVSERTIRKYLAKLAKLGLVRYEGDVRWREYAAA